MHRILAAAILTLPLAALAAPQAETPMTGAEFEAYAQGKTLSYAVNGQIYGAEQYLAGRKVIWAFAGDECRWGHWYEAGPEICFVYENDPAPQCWLFFAGPGGLTARYTGDADGSALKEVGTMPGGLACPGPDVGA